MQVVSSPLAQAHETAAPSLPRSLWIWRLMPVSVSCTRVLGRGSQSQKWLADGRSSGRCGVVAWTLRVGPATYRHIDVANCSITTIDASTSGPRLVGLTDTSNLPGSER
jgi:hypothetical protein